MITLFSSVDDHHHRDHQKSTSESWMYALWIAKMKKQGFLQIRDSRQSVAINQHLARLQDWETLTDDPVRYQDRRFL